jgi:hypothetical protein
MSTAPAFAFRPATSSTSALLRVEAFALLLAAVLLYARVSGDWLLFAKFFLLPDISIAFYIFGPRIGALAYNAAHSTIGALLLAALSAMMNEPFARAVALIWLGHIGFDRMLGYGLKHTSGFSDTHLGRVGPNP